MSDFEELKKRMPSAPAAVARHHHGHKVSGGVGKGAQAKHDALRLQPNQHLRTPGPGALSTYRDLPKSEPPAAAKQPPDTASPVNLAPDKAEAREKRIATLRNYLLAQVTAGRMELAQAEVAMMQFQEALDEGLPSYEE